MIYTYVCARTYIHTHTYISISISISLSLSLSLSLYVYIYTHIYTNTQTYLHIYILAYIDSYTCIHVYKCTLTSIQPRTHGRSRNLGVGLLAQDAAAQILAHRKLVWRVENAGTPQHLFARVFTCTFIYAQITCMTEIPHLSVIIGALLHIYWVDYTPRRDSRPLGG